MSLRCFSRINRIPRATSAIHFRICPWLVRCFQTTLVNQNQQNNPRDGYWNSNDAKHSKLQMTTDNNTSANTFSDLNVLGSVPPPASAIETIYGDGFRLSNGVTFRDGSGVLLVHNEGFKWTPAEQKSTTEGKAIKSGQLELGKGAWGMLDVMHPKPGTGKRTLQVSKVDRDTITDLGIRMDIMDTSHAASQYNLLATERPQGQVAAALLVDQFGVD